METKLIVGIVGGAWFVVANAAAGYFGYHWYLRGEELSKLKESLKVANEQLQTKTAQVNELQSSIAKLAEAGRLADKKRREAEAKLQPVVQQNQDFIRQLEASTPKDMKDDYQNAKIVVGKFIDYLQQLRQQPSKGTNSSTSAERLHEGLTYTAGTQSFLHEKGRAVSYTER